MNAKHNIKAVYSTRERALVASLVEAYKDKLESKKTDSTTNAIKNETWKAICEQYNTHDVTVRTPSQLKKCWENMKYKTRKSDTETQHSMLLTGGGPPEEDTTDVIDDMVRRIVPTISYTLSNSWDSTGLVVSGETTIHNNLQDIKLIESEASTSVIANKSINEKVLQNNVASAGNPELFIESGSNAPMPSRKEKININERKCSGSKILKRKRSEMCGINEEKELRLKKLKDSIEQQKEIHKLKVEAVEAEKLYWIERRKLLSTE